MTIALFSKTKRSIKRRYDLNDAKKTPMTPICTRTMTGTTTSSEAIVKTPCTATSIFPTISTRPATQPMTRMSRR